MGKWWKHAVLLLMVAVAGLGLSRIRFDTDILSILPGEMPEVAGLKAYYEVFSVDEELVVLIEGSDDDAGTLGAASEELAGLLTQAGVASNARWKPRWMDQPEGMAELLGWLWLNGEKKDAENLVSSLSPEQIDTTMGEALERVATSLDGGEMMMSAHDPLGFLGHPSMAAVFESAGEGGEGFESSDGSAHLFFVDAPGPIHGYKEAFDWIAKVKEVAEPWAAERGLKLSWTGEPAFQAEIGTAMENDMTKTIGVTSTLIALLFLLMQRRLGLLVGMTGVIGLVFLTAMGLAGWVYGELSIMAAGFAAILIGLTVDYGVLICQEAKLAGHDVGAIRKSTTKSIGWAAATTAAVFFALNLSGLPGIAQLGTIVAFGVIAGAVLMLSFYVPWVAWRGAGRPPITHKASWVPCRGRAAIMALGLALLAGGTLIWKGAPGVEFDNGLLRPRNSPAMAAFEAIQGHFPAWQAPSLKLVIQGASDAEVEARVIEAGQRLEVLKTERPGLVKSVDLPSGWWPTPVRVAENRELIESLVEDRERILAAAEEIGFSEEGTALGRSVLERLPEVLKMNARRVPDDEAAAEILRAYVFKNEQGGTLLGTVEIAHPEDLSPEDFASLRKFSHEGIHLAGWTLLKPAVLPLVKKDLVEVFLPMSVLMVVMLSLVFRNVWDVSLSLGMMLLSGSLLLAAMKLLGIGWNFLNIAATPLLLGTGLDYTIHILLAVRRTGGDLKDVWNGTGKAVLFCGASTAIGFGSLAFASNDALASLGKVAVLGILISMAVSIVLLPGIRGRRA
ncbi:MMPL family transporter [Haloferula chungangensis]|uniref:MMPL family transporter n=1 Tax=Haloferula chungangensis TaxID=1048331 RepID=A0ABW2L583_9BACT